MMMVVIMVSVVIVIVIVVVILRVMVIETVIVRVSAGARETVRERRETERDGDFGHKQIVV